MSAARMLAVYRAFFVTLIVAMGRVIEGPRDAAR